MKHALGLALIGMVLIPGAARADHPFILPSSTSYSGEGNVVTFDAAGSDHVFFFDHRPLQLASIKVWQPDGTPAEPYNMLQGRFRSVFDLKLDQQGTWKIASEQKMIGGTFMLNGEERRVGGRPGGAARPAGEGSPGAQAERRPPEGAPAGPRRQPPVAFQDIPPEATDVHLTEMVNRVETFVTAGAPTTTVFTPTGVGLEFEPLTHPNAIAAGEMARFRFLIDGHPAPGIEVTVIPGGDRYREADGAMTLKTGADGVVSVRWPSAGMYWLGATAEDKNPSEKKAEARRMSYSATLEVMTP